MEELTNISCNSFLLMFLFSDNIRADLGNKESVKRIIRDTQCSVLPKDPATLLVYLCLLLYYHKYFVTIIC